MRIPFTVTLSMCPYRDTWVISQKARAALKYMSGVGAEPRPPRLGPSSEAKVMWPLPPRLTVAILRNGVTMLTSASKTISRVWIWGSSPSGTVVMIAPRVSCSRSDRARWPSTSQFLERLHCLRRLRPSRVVGIGVRRANDTLAVDHEAGGDGQAPCAVAIASGQVDAELLIDGLKIGGQREGETVGLRSLVAEVAQHLERERLRLFRLACGARHLGRDDHQAGPGGGDLVQGLLQSLQLCVAVRSPAAAIEGQDDGPAREQRLQAHLLAGRVGKAEVRRRLAHLGHAGLGSRGPKLLDASLHDRPSLGGDPRLGHLADAVELFTQSHRALTLPASRQPRVRLPPRFRFLQPDRIAREVSIGRPRLRDPDLHVGREYRHVADGTQASPSSSPEAVTVHGKELAAVEPLTDRLAQGIARRPGEPPVGVEMATAGGHQDARLRHQPSAIETEGL